DAYNRHLIRYGTSQGLVASLTAEADGEGDDGRAARLLYAAARILVDRLGQAPPAIALLQKATARAQRATNDPVPAAHLLTTRPRILACLASLLEQNGDMPAAVEARLALLGELRDEDAIAHERIALADLFDATGQHDRAAEHARTALALDPLDSAAQERLD